MVPRDVAGKLPDKLKNGRKPSGSENVPVLHDVAEAIGLPWRAV